MRFDKKKNKRRKPELLAPAGDFEKLRVACKYGADAVYLGGERYGLRAAAGNFKNGELAAAVGYAHDKGVAVYVTVNIFARNDDIDALGEYLSFLNAIGADAVILSDPGVYKLVSEIIPEMDIHISVQANVTNYKSVVFWREYGAKRIVLARELSLAEITRIHDELPEDTELEAFVHGAMCISYSGRCILSNYLNRRDANAGECTHPCRFEYSLMESKRNGEYFPVEEDATGAYILSSKDLCMAAHIPELIGAGISAFKIEGRMKSAYYTALTTKIYREAIDDYYEEPQRYTANIPYYLEELRKIDNRGYTKGFFFGMPNDCDYAYDKTDINRYSFAGVVLEYDYEKGLALINQKNKFAVGQDAEFFGGKHGYYAQRIFEMYDEELNAISEAPHPKQRCWVKVAIPLEKHDMMRIVK